MVLDLAQGQRLELLPPAALAALAGIPGRSAPPVTPAQLAGATVVPSCPLLKPLA